MLSFWAELDVSAIESYARGLLLPEYMSHLALEHFEFSRQPHNRNGRAPLLLRYSGVGRAEEFLLPPEEHAPTMLERLVERIDPKKIILSEKDAIWNWSTAENPADGVLRIFFSSAPADSSPISDRPFSAVDAYVSVSRREIFLSHKPLREYVLQRCRAALRPDSPLLTPVAADRLTIETLAGTVGFRFGALAGTFLPGDEESSRALVRFARLDEPLGQLADYVTRNFMTGGVRLDDDGLHLPLVPK